MERRGVAGVEKHEGFVESATEGFESGSTRFSD
jgi:hypothetical protein